MIAVLLLSLLAAPGADYDALVARAVLESRDGRADAAAETLAGAIALDRRRPEAYVERGGLRFLQKRYDEAIADLETALRIRPDDAYARDVLASTLLLTGRYERAVAEWNRVGKPALGKVKLIGLRFIPEPAVRRELTVDEDTPLEVSGYRGTRVRLEETGFFQTIDLRPVVTGPGTVDLEIAVLERHGFGSVLQVAPRLAGDLFREKVRLNYANLARSGITIGGEYRWEPTQPMLAFRVDLFRPLGFPGMITIDGLRSRPTYDFEDGRGPFRLPTRGGGVRSRVVVASRTVAEAGLRVRDRTWDSAAADPNGAMIGLQLGVDHSFWSGRRHDFAGSVRTLTAPSTVGGDIHFTRATGRLVHHLQVQRPDALALEHGSIAVQALFGYGTSTTPIDEMYAPGAASEMDLPLRAHRQKNNGVLGQAPIARSMALVNFEYRKRFWSGRLARVGEAQFGGVLFYDGGRFGRTVRGGTETLHDVGVGARIGVRRTIILRADFGWSLSDGKTALTAGMGQVF